MEIFGRPERVLDMDRPDKVLRPGPHRAHKVTVHPQGMGRRPPGTDRTQPVHHRDMDHHRATARRPALLQATALRQAMGRRQAHRATDLHRVRMARLPDLPAGARSKASGAEHLLDRQRLVTAIGRHRSRVRRLARELDSRCLARSWVSWRSAFGE